MKKLRLIILLLISPLLLLSQITLDQLRRDYPKVATDSLICAKLQNQLKAVTSSETVILAYKGAVSCAYANHVRSKNEKIKYFSAGKKMLEQAIAALPTDPELRFLRLTIQTNCPKALGYRKNIPEDQDFLAKNIGQIRSESLQRKIVSWLRNSASLTDAQKEQLKASAK